MMKKNTLGIKVNRWMFALTIGCVLLFTSFSQAINFVVQTTNSSEKIDPFENPIPLTDPYYIWEDTFDTEENIELTMSENYSVDNGFAVMKNTNSLWDDPEWTRLKPITLTNHGSEPMSNHAVKFVIAYDKDMQSDYDDIRFKHEDAGTVFLDYWIERIGQSSASIWVKFPTIPVGESMVYLFYGNPNATDASNFYAIFSDWEEMWAQDEQLSYHSDNEGAWDSDVEYGNDRFLVTWEEGTYPLLGYTLYYTQEIRGSLYDVDGNIKKFDFPIYEGVGTEYRNENPSIGFGANKFLVAWEHYITPTDVTSTNINARMVDSSGNTGTVFTVCNEPNVQADPYVVFDSNNNYFCIVWEDGRSGSGNYNIYGKLYNTNGVQVGSEKVIVSDASSQCEPWMAFDSVNSQYMIVWEEGDTPDNGPFDVWMGLYDQNLNLIGPGSGPSPIKLADGDADTDFNFPCVAYSEDTELFLVTWNDCDISDGDWWGNVWGTVIDSSGNIVENTFQIKSGEFVRTDIVPYLPSTFLVSFDGNGKIWGKLVSTEADVFPDDLQLSASNSAVADWGKMAIGQEKIFITWEDKRNIYPTPWNGNPDSFGNIWKLLIPDPGDVSYVAGGEQKLVLEATVTSIEISPGDLIQWHEFGVLYNGSITFNILDSSGTVVLISSVSPGEDLTSIDPIQHPGIRLQAIFERQNPSYTPELDKWSVEYVGIDNTPPQTMIQDITGDLGNNGWYITNPTIFLSATDGLYGTGVNHTYYQIDSEDPEEYNDDVGIELPPGDPHILSGVWDVYYWSVDKAGNVEPAQGPETIKLDKADPYVEIWDPADTSIVRGDFWVQVDASDVGSGIAYVDFDTGPPYDEAVRVYEDDPPGSGIYRWYCTRHHLFFKHIIAVAYDYAGNMDDDNIWVFFWRAIDIELPFIRNIKIYQPFDVSDVRLGLLFNSELEVKVSGYEDIDSIEFIATTIFTRKTQTIVDDDVTDGWSAAFDTRIGLYKLTAIMYQDDIEQERTVSRVIYIPLG